jgi:hypothetical protein
LWWGEKEFTGHHEQGVDAMRLFCSLSKAARIVLWIVIVSALVGLILGYQAGSSGSGDARGDVHQGQAVVADRQN